MIQLTLHFIQKITVVNNYKTIKILTFKFLKKEINNFLFCFLTLEEI